MYYNIISVHETFFMYLLFCYHTVQAQLVPNLVSVFIYDCLSELIERKNIFILIWLRRN